MRLKRLEVHGFKSFADTTAFGFEPGLTGIVGPNGCGKSNVVDAIKWVLGETRPTSLRGSEMQDVIFKGTAARQPLGYSQVTLVLDNSAEVIPGPSEIELTRRLFRTGDGEYLLNQKDVRRKDLKQLLYGTGLGVNAYSILEQGKIDAVLSANALDRRAIFEEASGITRFRVDRKEALRRLESTEKDLESVRAVLNELERQRNSLRVQASRARRHGEFADQLRGWRTAAALARYQEKRAERDRAGEAVLEFQRQEQSAREARAAAEADATHAREESRRLAAEETRLAAELASIVNDETRQAERHQAAAGQSAELLHSAKEKRVKGEAALLALTPLRDELARAQAELDRCTASLAEAERELETRTEELRNANELYRNAGRELEAAQTHLLHSIESRTSAHNALADLEAEERAARGEDERLKRRVNDLDNEIARLEPEKSTAETRHQESAARLLELRNDEGRIRGARAAAEAALAETDSRIAEVQRHLTGLQSRIGVLRELESSMAGVAAGAKALVQGQADGVLGLVANVVHADLAMAPALEAALGRYADGVIVNSEETAGTLLAHVRERKLGRVTFLVSRETADRAVEFPAFAENEGVIGPLAGLVKIDGPAAGPLRALLANVVVVETLTDAFRHASRHPSLTFVTRLGERVDFAGVSAGTGEAAASPIARKSAITALDAEIAGARQEARIQETLRDRARVALVQAKGDEERWNSAVGAAMRDVNEHQVALSDASHRLSRLHNEHSLLTAECEGVRSRLHDLAGRRGILEESRAAAAADVQRASVRVQEIQVQRQELERQRDEANANEASARIVAAETRGEQERWRSETARHQDALTRAGAESDRLAAEAAREHARAEELYQEAAALTETLSSLAEQREQAETQLAAVRGTAAARESSLEGAVARERERNLDVERVNSELANARLDAQRASLLCEEIVARAKADAGVSIEDLREVITLDAAFSLELADAKIAEYRNKLDKIGSVSSDATDELDSVETRHADLDRQRADLETAKKTLQDTIGELDVRCLSRFKEAFESIRQHFSDLFRRLFRGGKADILLADGVDPLEAGVEIFAQPPGKKLQSISLLSGGERTLTALALLFAAFRYKPSPFCVLDEVDAALDDANVERFLGMLEEFKGTTQFVVVTHHRRTMAACSALLGVTMPERGVSQKVAVKLDEVDKVVPGAVGSLPPSDVKSPNGGPHPSVKTAGVESDEESLAVVEVVPMPARGVAVLEGAPPAA